MITNKSMIPDASLTLKQTIKAESERLGFCFCGFTGTEKPADYSRYLEWIASESYGTMRFLARADHLAKKADCTLIFSEAHSICVLGVPIDLALGKNGIAAFAHYRDYHDQISEMCEILMARVQTASEIPINYKVCVDSAPLLERSLAVRAGLGWIGKNSMFIHPVYGSAVLLCEILLDQAIVPDKPFDKEFCGTCRRCVDACPATCIDPDLRTIRADQCVSYLTIEYKGEFNKGQTRVIGSHIFGCDQCTFVCPWNKRAFGRISPLELSSVLPSFADLELDDAQYKHKYRGTSFFRLKKQGLIRNLRNLSMKDDE